MKTIIVAIVFFTLGILTLFLYSKTRQYPVPPIDSTARNLSLGITVYRPFLYQDLKSPTIIFGEAQNFWFSEGKFSVTLEDEKGNVLGNGFVTAKADWTKPAYNVPFMGELTFKNPGEKIYLGKIIFSSKNLSPDNKSQLQISYPIQFPYKP